MSAHSAFAPVSPVDAAPRVPPPALLPTSVLSAAPAPATVAWAIAGVGVFGFALRTAAEKSAPDWGHLGWSLALPGALLLAWTVCLPALYIFWGSKQGALAWADLVRAAGAAFKATGACLASTAPVLWFFSVTAPASRLVSPLGWLFTALALTAGGWVFAAGVRDAGVPLPVKARLGFLALLFATFVQFSHATGLHWF